MAVGGVERWGSPIPCGSPGVYLVTATADPHAHIYIPHCPIATAAVAELLAARPELTLDGRRPTPEELAGRIASFWLPDEPVVYVGLAGTSLRSRVGAYYSTRLGARGPHAGGWFVKVVAGIVPLHVHWAVADDPAGAESLMLAAFCQGVSPVAGASLHDPAHPLPFANLEWPPGTAKRHGIEGARATQLRRPGP